MTEKDQTSGTPACAAEDTHSHAALLDKIEQSKALDKEAEAELTNAITAFKKSFA